MLHSLFHHKNQILWSLARVNDRILLQVGRRSFLSRIEDIHAQQEEMHVAVPLCKGEPISLAPGREIRLRLFTDRGLREFECKVKCMVEKRVTLVVLHRFKSLGVFRQRDYDRVEDNLPVRFRREGGSENTAPWRHAVTCDVSGGGVQMLAQDVWLLAAGDIVELELALRGEAAVRSVAQVVRAEDAGVGKSKSRLAMNFLEIDESDRERLVQYVRRKKAELAESRNSFIRCDHKLKVLYQRRSRKGELSKYKTGWAQDISASGFRMIVNDAEILPSGEQLEVSITLPGLAAIEAVCEVVWIRPVDGESGGRHEVGIRFVIFCLGGREKMLEFLSQIKDRVKEREAA